MSKIKKAIELQPKKAFMLALLFLSLESGSNG